MMHVTLIIADTTIIATMLPGENDLWDVQVGDNHAGQMERGKWTQRQLNAVITLALGMGEDNELSPEVVASLYATAEPLFAGWAEKVRPIP